MYIFPHRRPGSGGPRRGGCIPPGQPPSEPNQEKK